MNARLSGNFGKAKDGTLFMFHFTKSPAFYGRLRPRCARVREMQLFRCFNCLSLTSLIDQSITCAVLYAPQGEPSVACHVVHISKMKEPEPMALMLRPMQYGRDLTIHRGVSASVKMGCK